MFASALKTRAIARCELPPLIFSLSMCLSQTAIAQQYEVGYEWKRQTDFQPGSAEGLTINNPGVDSKGSPVWFYWTTSGGGIIAPTPWYTQPRSPMVWDVPTFNQAAGPKPRWSRAGNGTEPGVDADTISLSRTLKPGGWPYQALVAFRNPAGNGVIVDVLGKVIVTWAGTAQTAVNDFQVQLAIVRRSAAANLYSPLLIASLQRPSFSIASNTWRTEFPIAYKSVLMDSDDELIFSINNTAGYPVASGTAWVTLGDRLRIRVVGYEY